MDIEAIKRAFRDIPHTTQVSNDDFRAWLHATHETDPSRLLWHLQRQKAVGGSEVGTLLLEAQGLIPPFGRTGAMLAAEKLFKIPPSKPLPHMMRGIFLEKPMIEAMLNIYGGKRDSEAELAIQLPNPRSPQSMAGNTDLYWKLNNNRILVDMKVPMSATDEDNVGADNHKLFTYKSQIHHYDLLGSLRGYQADKLVLAELDVPVELADTWTSMLRSGQKGSHKHVVEQMTLLLANERPGMRFNLIEVEKDLSVDLYGKDTPIREAITRVCGDFMSGLVNGDMIRVPEKVVQEPSQHLVDQINQLDKRMGSLRAISEYVEGEVSVAQAQARELVSEHKVNPKALSTLLFKIDQKPKFDTQSAISTLSRYPINLDDLQKAKDPEECGYRDLDVSKAIEKLRELGHLESCMKDPGYGQDKIEGALSAVGEDPEVFVSHSVSFKKNTQTIAKTRYTELKGLAQGIEETLALKELKAQQALQSAQHQEQQTHQEESFTGLMVG